MKNEGSKDVLSTCQGILTCWKSGKGRDGHSAAIEPGPKPVRLPANRGQATRPRKLGNPKSFIVVFRRSISYSLSTIGLEFVLSKYYLINIT